MTRAVWIRVGELTLAIPVRGPAPPTVSVALVDGDDAVAVELATGIATVRFGTRGPDRWRSIGATTCEAPDGELDFEDPSPDDPAAALAAPLRLLRAA